MKKYNFAIIGVTLLLSLSACNDWLDIDPSDQVSSEKLFESGDGFRNALNGIYIAMSSSELYGRELSWGLPVFFLKHMQITISPNLKHMVALWNMNTEKRRSKRCWNQFGQKDIM